MEVEFLSRLPTTPDRTQRPNVVPQAWRGRGPGDAEATLVVALHLAAKSQHEATARVGLQVPCLRCQHCWTARECHSDRWGQFDAFGCRGGDGEWCEHVMAKLDGHHGIEARRLTIARSLGSRLPVMHRQAGEYAHDAQLEVAAARLSSW